MIHFILEEHTSGYDTVTNGFLWNFGMLRNYVSNWTLCLIGLSMPGRTLYRAGLPFDWAVY
ncbi:MAG: hypothetical protein LKJ57_06390 [Ancrocorticia sp.]|nr:hypothetical protein [Ancrocorticia sp.]MCI1963326.1 hypothetical protein [Ancrocorticia sp.]MCI2002825.1 hypothetical protein [Ancrocorticia sp.]MCI2013209.1 hypothetical protein [Ancrocorticia sp.]MCI2177799.1 hypothetical protein [Ancrocorticia sp.]